MMDISDIDILWCVLLFSWIVYAWDTYLSFRQVIYQSVSVKPVGAPGEFHHPGLGLGLGLGTGVVKFSGSAKPVCLKSEIYEIH